MKGVVSQALLVSLSEVLMTGMSQQQVWGICGMKAPSLWGQCVNGAGLGGTRVSVVPGPGVRPQPCSQAGALDHV